MLSFKCKILIANFLSMEKSFYIAKYERSSSGDVLVYQSEKFTWTESSWMTLTQFKNYSMHAVVQKVWILPTQVFSVIPA